VENAPGRRPSGAYGQVPTATQKEPRLATLAKTEPVLALFDFDLFG